MNAKARQLGLQDTHFVRPDGLDAPGHVSSAADVTKLARVVMRIPFVRNTVRQRTATIAGGRTLHTWDDLLTQFPQTIGVKTGHTGLAGWCQVAAARSGGVTVYATLLGSPDRSDRNDDLESLLVWGLSRFRVVPAVQPGRTYASVAVGYGKAPLGLVGGAAAARRDQDRPHRSPRPSSPRRASRCRSAAARSSGGSRSVRDPTLWGFATS